MVDAAGAFHVTTDELGAGRQGPLGTLDSATAEDEASGKGRGREGERGRREREMHMIVH